MWGCWLLALVLVPAGIMMGEVACSLGDFIDFLGGNVRDPLLNAVLHYRWPRVAGAFCAGAILALCGLVMQAMVRNPLADPYLLGISGGSGLMVNLVLLGGGTLLAGTTYPGIVASVLGASLGLLMIMILGRSSGLGANGLLIAGIAAGSMFTCLNGIVIYLLAGSDHLRKVMFWTFGSLQMLQPAFLPWLIAAAILILIWTWWAAPRLDALLPGDEYAISCGVRPQTLRLQAAIVVSIATGICISFCGPIGFVGMVLPHTIRNFTGAAHRPLAMVLFPFSGAYLVLCDILARNIAKPLDIPVGMVTSMVGVPLFLYLVWKQRNQGSLSGT